MLRAAATLVQDCAEYDSCEVSESVGSQLSAGRSTTAEGLLILVATAAAAPTHSGMRLMAQTVHATLQVLQMTAAAETKSAAAAAAAGTAAENRTLWALTVEPCTRLLADLLDLQLHTVADGSSTQQQLLQLSYAVLVVEAGMRSIMSATPSMLCPERAATTSSSSSTAGSSPSSRSLGGSSSRWRPRLWDLTPSARLANITLDGFTLRQMCGVQSSCSALLCKALSSDADHQSLLLDSLHGQVLVQAVLSLQLTDSKVCNSYSRGASTAPSLLPAVLMLASAQSQAASKAAAAAFTVSSSSGGSWHPAGWDEPLQMSLCLMARLLLASATHLNTHRPDMERWMTGKHWVLTNFLQPVPSVADSNPSSTVHQLQQQAQKLGISNVATLSGQVELAHVYLITCGVASSSSSSGVSSSLRETAEVLFCVLHPKLREVDCSLAQWAVEHGWDLTKPEHMKAARNLLNSASASCLQQLEHRLLAAAFKLLSRHLGGAAAEAPLGDEAPAGVVSTGSQGAQPTTVADALRAAGEALLAAMPCSFTCNNPYCSNFSTVSEGFALVRSKACVCGGCVGISSAAAAATAGAAPRSALVPGCALCAGTGRMHNLCSEL